MPTVEVWMKLACYVACIGIALELAHKLYWNLYRTIHETDVSPTTKAFFSLMFSTLPLIAVYMITAAFCHYVDDKSVVSLGLKRYPGYMSDIISGTGIAFACVSIMFVIGCSFGWFKVKSSANNDNMESVSAFSGGITDLFVSSVFEEMAIRGYVFFVLQQAVSGQFAVMGSVLIFAILHMIRHPRVPVVFTLNAVLFGLLAGQCRLLTGMLWVPIGLHFGWNLAMGPIFGLPYSGRDYEDGLVTCSVEGPQWITGGNYSPDAGILGTVTLGIAAVAMMSIVPV